VLAGGFPFQIIGNKAQGTVPGARGGLPLRYARDLQPLAAIPLDAISPFGGTLLNVRLDIGMSPRSAEPPAAPLGTGSGNDSGHRPDRRP